MIEVQRMTYSIKVDTTAATRAEREQLANRTLPIEFIKWQIESRAEMCRTIALQGAGGVRKMPAHLPVLATHCLDGSINLATKGIGLLPSDKVIDEFTSIFKNVASNAGCGIRDRVDALMNLYSEPGNFDVTKLGGLEIFEGSTFSNLRRDPRASLLFTGEAPSFVSYQIDGRAEFVSKDDRHFEYLLAARELFARDSFHVLQTNYPLGFVLNVTNVRDKRPFTRV